MQFAGLLTHPLPYPIDTEGVFNFFAHIYLISKLLTLFYLLIFCQKIPIEGDVSAINILLLF